MKFRIRKYPKGWIVEVQKTKWYGKKYWTHWISVAGIVDEPWYHGSFNLALDSFIFKMQREIIINSQS